MTSEERRDFFAAHAPAEPAHWFVPKNVPDPPYWAEHSKNPTPHGCTAIKNHCEKCDEYFVREAAFKAEQDRRASDYELARYVQWPWAWADAVILAGGHDESLGSNQPYARTEKIQDVLP